MITEGTIPREVAAQSFPFLAKRYRGRRSALKAFTHTAPDFVFWISPEGGLIDARDSHLRHPPKGRRDILDDEPDYGGYLRGRVATNIEGQQLVAVYCRAEALSGSSSRITQLLSGLDSLPVPLQARALVVSDNGDLYGTVDDLRGRLVE